MNTQINKAIADLLNEPKVLPPEPEKDEAPGPFKFKTERDPMGLPIEHVDYIKASCKTCYGRGFITGLLGDGYRQDPTAGRVARLARRQVTCGCVRKGYSKVRGACDLRIALDLDSWRASRKAELEKGLEMATTDDLKAGVLKMYSDTEKAQRARYEREALVASGYADAKAIAAVQAGT